MNHNIVVLDSNFILLPFQFKIDYLNEIRYQLEGSIDFLIFKQVFDELEAKKKREDKSIKFRNQLNSGLAYLEQNRVNFNIIIDENVKKSNETTDEFLLNTCIQLKAQYNRVFLATNDSQLRRNAKLNGINLIYLRQKRYIVIERI